MDRLWITGADKLRAERSRLPVWASILVIGAASIGLWAAIISLAAYIPHFY
jgi:hypothetical protein